jgi:flagellar hook assembly protein FlgD
LAVSGDFAFTTLSPVLPVISSFTPTSGPVGAQVTIAGSNFTGATGVAFNGTVAAGFVVETDNQIQATVPTGATTGKISVTNVAGTAVSAADFSVIITLAFDPTDDAYVQSSNPTKNYGTSSQLRVRRTSSTQVNTYLKFNITGLSGGVRSAKLRLYVADAGSDGGAVYAVSNNYLGTNTPWVEKGLKWNNAPTISGNPLSSAGAVKVGQTVELDVAAAIIGDGVYSFALKNNSSNEVVYQSKQGANPPVLVIQAAASAAQTTIAVEEKSPPVHPDGELPEQFALYPNYPNPLRLSAFNAETRFVYQLPKRAHVKLTLYDLLGREVLILVDAEREPGAHEAAWNGRDATGALLPSGTYIYRLETIRFSISKKLLLVK